MSKIKVNFTDEQLQALNYYDHGIVTANAGSGKTKVFSSRFVNIAQGIIIDENGNYIEKFKPIDVRKIVAITFTDKAASELYTKIAKEVDERIENKFGNVNQLKRLRRNLVSANISTIHSFCSDILKRFPLQAGLDITFIPIDKRISSELIEKSIEETFKEILQNEDHVLQNDLKYLIRVLGSKWQFSETLSDAISNQRNNIADLKETLYSRSAEGIAKFFAGEFDRAIAEIIHQKEIDRFLKDLVIINSEVEESILNDKKPNQNKINYQQKMNAILSGYNSLNNFYELCRLFDDLKKDSLLTTGNDLRSQSFASSSQYFKDNKDEINSLLNLVDKMYVHKNRTDLEAHLANFGMSFIKIFDAVNQNYEAHKKENDFLDFEDILIKAKNLIKNNNDVVEELQKEIDYIMIDEYQDTNQLQYDLVIPILSEIAETLNEKLNRETGNLFVVGDEKQSIYMFRNADLKVFNDTAKDIFNSAKKDKMRLPHSFRMAANNCLFSNYIFQNLFKLDEQNIVTEKFNQVENENLICGIGKSPKGLDLLGRVELLLKNEDDELTEAELVAKKILKLLNDENFAFDKNLDNEEIKLSYKNIAVLTRKRSAFDELEKAFVKFNIPYVIIGGRGFYSNQIIKDVYNYLAFLVNQNDDVALTGVLRSTFFSIADSLIYQISLENGNSLWQKFKLFAKKEDAQNSLNEIIKILKDNISTANKVDLPVLLKKILSETPFLTVLASRKNGAQDLANIDKLVRISGDFQKSNYSTLFDFVEFLKDSIENKSDEPQAAVISDEDAVKIMTIHQSKGLEFPAVFLFESAAKSQKDSLKTGEVTISRDFGIITKVENENYFNERETPPIGKLYSFIQAKKEEAELKRLFYVAVTRAAFYLGISSVYKEQKNGDVNFNILSFMGLLEKGLNVNFAEVIQNEKIQISDSLGIYQNNKTEYEELTLEIPLIQNIEDVEIKEQSAELKEYEFNLNELKDYQETEETFTATKYADITKSVDNYFKKYILNIDKYSGLKKEIVTELEEENLTGLGALKGTVIHLILSRDVNPENVNEELIEFIIKDEIDFPYTKNEKILKKFKTEILNELQNYFNSNTYKEINKYNDFKNEYEIWHYDEKHKLYLHGIIDKVIINNDELIIIDYKSNDITENQIEEKINYYMPQLEFYAAVLCKKYKNIKKAKLRIIFTKFPDVGKFVNVNCTEIIDNVTSSLGLPTNLRDKIFQDTN